MPIVLIAGATPAFASSSPPTTCSAISKLTLAVALHDPLTNEGAVPGRIENCVGPMTFTVSWTPQATMAAATNVFVMSFGGNAPVTSSTGPGKPPVVPSPWSGSISGSAWLLTYVGPTVAGEPITVDIPAVWCDTGLKFGFIDVEIDLSQAESCGSVSTSIAIPTYYWA